MTMGRKKRVSLQEPHFSRMEKLLKTKDMRFNSNTYKNLNRNDVMNFFLKDSDRPQLPRRVVKKFTYKGSTGLKRVCDLHVNEIFPGGCSFEYFESMYYSFGYSRKGTEKEGVVVFELQPLNVVPPFTINDVDDEERKNLGQPLVYQVCCRKVKRRFRFFGRSKNSRDEEPLTVDWLMKNGFDDPYLSWFKDNLGKWEPMPLGKSVKKDSVLRCPITSDTPCVPRCVVNVQSVFFHQKDKWYCTTYPLASVCDYKGLYRQKKIVLDNSERISLHTGNRLNESVTMFYNTGGWSKVIQHGSFDVLEDDVSSQNTKSSQNIKILQLCSAPRGDEFDNEKFHDNQHSVVVIDHLIFDSNHKGPLVLNAVNLDRCCVGGSDWVFHHVSSCYEFVPSTTLQKYMNRHTKQKRKM